MRPAYKPTDAQRDAVRAAVASGEKQAEIASALGVSLPTLRKHFRDELGTKSRDCSHDDATLFDVEHVHTPPSSTRAQSAPSGRPSYRPLPSEREKVEVWSAAGMSQREIALALGISEPTLREHFRDELDFGPAKRRAEALTMLHKAARDGNVAAIRALKSHFEEAELTRLQAMGLVPVAPERRERPETPGKKAVALADAHNIMAESDWAGLLGGALQ